MQTYKLLVFTTIVTFVGIIRMKLQGYEAPGKIRIWTSRSFRKKLGLTASIFHFRLFVVGMCIFLSFPPFEKKPFPSFVCYFVTLQ